jgi:uracil-DNA glycosylase family 4
MSCDNCTLRGNPKVLGYGKEKPLIVFVGEAPGATEVEKGQPFVGKAGRILHSILNYLGFDDYYLTNTCLCRPPENRNPSKEEIACCFPRLLDEIVSLNPKYIVAMGAVPADAVFGETLKSGRGKILTSKLNDIPGIITYHPAAALYPKGETILPYIQGDIEKIIKLASGVYLQEWDEDMANPKTTVMTIETDQQMAELIERLYKLPAGTEIACDWETTGLSHILDSGFCFGLSWKPGTGVSIPLDFVRYNSKELYNSLADKTLVGYNSFSFDDAWNEKYSIPPTEIDVQLMHYLLDERPQQRSLENLSMFYLNAPPYESEMMAEYTAKKSEMIQKVPPEVIYNYCGKDVDWTLRLYRVFKEEFKAWDTDTISSLWNLIKAGAKTFADIEDNGFWVDVDRLATVKEEVELGLEEEIGRLQEITEDKGFNPRSHKQVQEMLWDTLKLDQPKLHGRKNRSANHVTLEALRGEPFVDALLSYRDLYTLYSRYVRDLHEFIDPDKRIRCSYNFDRTETGRLSTTNPPIHQIPRDSRVRGIFSAPPGNVLIQADYAQIEIRMAAYIAKDEKLTAFLNSGADFHTTMAAQAYQIPLDKVSKEQRQAAKGVSFGLLYLMSDKGLMAQTGLPFSEAREFVTKYKEGMPGVQKWIREIKEIIRTKQIIESPFGRRRRFPLLTEDKLEGLYREGVNFPIQSGASDLTLTSAIKLHKFINDFYPEAKIVAMVHDSLIIEANAYIANSLAEQVTKIMEATPFETDVPFPIDIKISERWGE